MKKIMMINKIMNLISHGKFKKYLVSPFTNPKYKKLYCHFADHIKVRLIAHTAYLLCSESCPQGIF
jgi:hypothetical protein